MLFVFPAFPRSGVSHGNGTFSHGVGVGQPKLSLPLSCHVGSDGGYASNGHAKHEREIEEKITKRLSNRLDAEREVFFAFSGSFQNQTQRQNLKNGTKKQIHSLFFVKNAIFYDKKYKKAIDELGIL